MNRKNTVLHKSLNSILLLCFCRFNSNFVSNLIDADDESNNKYYVNTLISFKK